MPRELIIGTRDSPLALWQARHIADLLSAAGYPNRILEVKSEGDLDTQTPLYELGVQGIFTRTLDTALLTEKIDVAVHSLKDVPTRLPEGLSLAGVPKRGETADLLIGGERLAQIDPAAIRLATGSMRRRAFWLDRYPKAQIVGLRGNVQTRLAKVQDAEGADAAIMAEAAVQRAGLRPAFMKRLEWMLPAPGQGALGLICRDDDDQAIAAVATLHDPDAAAEVTAERTFLRELMGGCSLPIAAKATHGSGMLALQGCVLRIDGSQRTDILLTATASNAETLGATAARSILQQAGSTIIASWKRNPS